MNFSLGFVFGTIFGAMATVTIIAVLFMSKREPAEREYYCSVYEIDSNELVYNGYILADSKRNASLLAAMNADIDCFDLDKYRIEVES